MPNSENKPKPPSANNLDGFELRQPEGVYFLLKHDRVWLDALDGEPYYVHPEDYPAGIVKEFERRLAFANRVGKVPLWHQESERNVPKFELIRDNPPEKEAEHAFRVVLGQAMNWARKNGQFSIKARIIVDDQKMADDPHTRTFLAKLTVLLQPPDAVLESGAVLGKMTETGRICYIPITISW
ncbi:MAG: hypothetical protein JWL88_254 [Parcubacteria group bacterium]|nr:hypothetical protein [Parcubacteria group bacterium]